MSCSNPPPSPDAFRVPATKNPATSTVAGFFFGGKNKRLLLRLEIRGKHRLFVRANGVPVAALRTISKKTFMVRIINRPHQRAIARRNKHRINFFTRKKRELPFIDFRRQTFNRLQAFKQKHKPVPASLVRTLGNHSEKMQVRRGKAHSRFLKRFAARTLKRRFAGSHFQFSSDRTPATLIRSFPALNHQKLSVPVADKNQNADFERQNRRR